MDHGESKGLERAVLFCGGGDFYRIYTSAPRFRAKKQVQEIEQYREPNEFTFDEEGITVEWKGKVRNYPWEKIVRVVAAPKTIGFYYDENQALSVPKEDFKDRFVPIMTMVTQHVRPGCVRLR